MPRPFSSSSRPKSGRVIVSLRPPSADGRKTSGNLRSGQPHQRAKRARGRSSLRVTRSPHRPGAELHLARPKWLTEHGYRDLL
jgi:hypothetical protein